MYMMHQTEIDLTDTDWFRNLIFRVHRKLAAIVINVM